MSRRLLWQPPVQTMPELHTRRRLCLGIERHKICPVSRHKAWLLGCCLPGFKLCWTQNLRVLGPRVFATCTRVASSDSLLVSKLGLFVIVVLLHLLLTCFFSRAMRIILALAVPPDKDGPRQRNAAAEGINQSDWAAAAWDDGRAGEDMVPSTARGRASKRHCF